ncbi:unnamed protein product, partial [Rotaria sordida]
LTILCGGRNDLSNLFYSSSLNNSSNTSTSEEISSNNNTIFNMNWNNLALNLLHYNTSDMCNMSYVVGSNNIKQTILINRTCRCILFDQIFNSNQQLKQFNRLIRPLLYGKIYYYPSNIHYDNLIKQINQTFESLDELIKLFRYIQLTIQSTYQIFLIICNLSLNSLDICQQQLNSYTISISLYTIFTEFIACIERNRFIPMISELNLIEHGQNSSLTDTFLAGIVFLNNISNNDSLPKHIQCKIRMTLDNVDNSFQTEDR